MTLPEISPGEVRPLLAYYGLPVRRPWLAPPDLVRCLRGTLRCSLDRVYAAIQRGELPALDVRPAGAPHATWRFLPSDVARWVLARDLFWANHPTGNPSRRRV